MSDKFNFGRFGKYLAYDLKSHWKGNAFYLVILALWPVVFYMIYMFFSALGQNWLSNMFSDIHLNLPPIAVRVGVFAVMTGVFLITFPSKAYGFLTEKAKGSEWIELPASRLEKFASMMLISLIIIPAVYFCGYFLSDALVCLADKECGTSIISGWRNLHFSDDAPVTLGANGAWGLISGTLQTVSVFLLGALIFKKGKILKTILALFVLTMILFAISTTVFSSIDLSAFGDKITAWFSNHVEDFDFWINFWGNVELAVVVIGLGIWSWFRVKKLQH